MTDYSSACDRFARRGLAGNFDFLVLNYLDLHFLVSSFGRGSCRQ